jgi:hypothetical protein
LKTTHLHVQIRYERVFLYPLKTCKNKMMGVVAVVMVVMVMAVVVAVAAAVVVVVVLVAAL